MILFIQHRKIITRTFNKLFVWKFFQRKMTKINQLYKISIYCSFGLTLFLTRTFNI